MSNKQNKVGKATENIIAQYFKSKRYWAFIVPKSINGQPFDVIALNKEKKWLVDAKHLEESEASFPFNRIEPNQITSMSYARIYAGIDKYLGFIIKWDREPNRLFYLDYDIFIELKEKGLKSIKISELKDMEDVI